MMGKSYLQSILCTVAALFLLLGACKQRIDVTNDDTFSSDSGTPTEDPGERLNDPCSPIGIIETGRVRSLEGCFRASDGSKVHFTSNRETDITVTCAVGPNHPGIVTARFWIEGGDVVEVNMKDRCLDEEKDIVPPGPGEFGDEPSAIPEFKSTHNIEIYFNDIAVTHLLPENTELPWEGLKEFFDGPLGEAVQMIPLELAIEESSEETQGELAALVAPWQFGLRHLPRLALEQAVVTAEAASQNFFAPELFSEGLVEEPWWVRPTDLIFSEALPFPHVFGYLPFEPPPYIVPPQAFEGKFGGTFSMSDLTSCSETAEACSGACGQGCYSGSCVGVDVCPRDFPLKSQGEALGIQWTCQTNSVCQNLDTGLSTCSKAYTDCNSWGRGACFVQQELSCIKEHDRALCLRSFFGSGQVETDQTLSFQQVEDDGSVGGTASSSSPWFDEVACLEDGEDEDNDGLLNAEEIEASLDPWNPDTDGDGVLDGQDACPLEPGDGDDGCVQILIGEGCEGVCKGQPGISVCHETGLCECTGEEGEQPTPCEDGQSCWKAPDDSGFGDYCGTIESLACASACILKDDPFLDVCSDENVLCSCTPPYEPYNCKAELDQKCVTDPNDGPACTAVNDCYGPCLESGGQDTCLSENTLCTCAPNLLHDCTETSGNVCIPSALDAGEAICGPDPGLTIFSTCAYVCPDLPGPTCSPESPIILCLCGDDATLAKDCSVSSFTDTCEIDQCVASTPTPGTPGNP
jgi:hypothetical protein